MTLQFAFLLLVLAASVQSQTPVSCNSTGITSCGACLNLNQQDPPLSCGWCGATQTCLSKDANRQPVGQNCFGSTWEPEICTACETLTDCRSCNAHPGDCSFCGNPPSCRERTLGCQAAPCACDQYNDDCAGCLSDPGCNFCAGDNTCKAATDTTCVDKYTPAQGCPCSHNAECDSCRAQPGCGWCASGECQSLSNLTSTCMLSMNCNAYCKQRGATCNNCTALSGCSWCDDTSTCVDSSIQSSCFLTHQCPPSCDHKYCDTCLDAGCTWCRDSRKCMSLNQAKNSSCMSALSCPSFCQGYSSCGDCNQVLGCAWCGDSNTCVDKDKASTCMFALTCDPVPLNPTCPSFSGGSFVGGMFLVIGLLVVVVAAFAFYRWYTGKKILYTQLR